MINLIKNYFLNIYAELQTEQGMAGVMAMLIALLLAQVMLIMFGSTKGLKKPSKKTIDLTYL